MCERSEKAPCTTTHNLCQNYCVPEPGGLRTRRRGNQEEREGEERGQGRGSERRQGRSRWVGSQGLSAEYLTCPGWGVCLRDSRGRGAIPRDSDGDGISWSCVMEQRWEIPWGGKGPLPTYPSLGHHKSQKAGVFPSESEQGPIQHRMQAQAPPPWETGGLQTETRDDCNPLCPPLFAPEPFISAPQLMMAPSRPNPPVAPHCLQDTLPSFLQ